EVQSCMRGNIVRGSRMVLRLPGGVVGRIGQQIPGVPFPEMNRPSVMFLSRADNLPGVFYLTHLTASVLPMVVGMDGSVTVMPAAEGLLTQGARSLSNAARPAATMMPSSGTALDLVVRTVRSVR